jgi:carbonic anhydrase
VTVPADALIPTETARPTITNPDAALKQLMDGNARFVDAKMVHPAQDPEHRLRVSQGQQPFAVILTCSDSRLPPEVIFDQGLGDLFASASRAISSTRHCWAAWSTPSTTSTHRWSW